MSQSFQPTLPLRGATMVNCGVFVCSGVSTHAPLAGSDGARDGVADSLHQFQPTLPLRGATVTALMRSSKVAFQPTLPLRGATSWCRIISTRLPGFNPRSPCGERPLHLVNVALRAYHMHDVFHPNASSDELRPSETNQKAVRTSQEIPDSPQFAPPIIPTAYS